MAKRFPDVIYLETSILLQLPREFEKAEYLLLEELCQVLKVRIVTTQLCFDELLHKRKTNLEAQISAVRSGASTLTPYVASPPDLTWLNNPTILREFENRTVADFRKRGIEILKDVSVDQGRLKEMAIKKILPFTAKGEKGFRDAIILFTVIDHERQLKDKGYYGLLLSNDDALRDALKSLPESGDLEIVGVRSIFDANVHLKGFLKQALQDIYDQREQRVLAFLNNHLKEIEAFIRVNGSFPEFSLVGAGPGLFNTIDRIAAIDLLGIERPVSSLLAGEAKEGKVTISFSARVRLTLLIVSSSLPVRRLKLKAEEQQVESIRPITDLPPLFGESRKQTEVSVERLLSVQASFDLRIQDDVQEYFNLVLEGVQTEESPFAALLRGELQ